MQKNKTVQTHIDRILKTKRFEKSEINALTKLIQSSRFGDDERKLDVHAMLDSKVLRYATTVDLYRHGDHFEANVHLFPQPCKISKDQTLQGKTYLKNRYQKKNGEPRLCVDRELSQRAYRIAVRASRFEFVGIMVVYSDRGFGRSICNVLPIYRTFNGGGEYFDYAPIHWDAPVIMEGF